MPAEPRSAERPTYFHAAIGRQLTCYRLDPKAATLLPGATIRLPSKVQYAWPHRSGSTLYVASSDAEPARGIVGQAHWLTALRVDPATGALAPHGAAVVLPARPIHVSLDPQSRYALVAFNAPAAVRVYGIAADGTLAAGIEPDVPPDLGSFPHQVLVAPDSRHVLVPARGHDATATAPERPGVLNVFDTADGTLGRHQRVRPGRGYGFGPRHLDFHPEAPWVYVVLERQNELAFFAWAADGLEPEPRCKLSTLAGQVTGGHQLAGAIKMHPSGRFLYVSNRTPEVLGGGAQSRVTGGDNTIAVYGIDQRTGIPAPLAHVDSGGIHCRNLTIAGEGTILIASHVAGFEVAAADGDAAGAGFVPGGLSVFRIGGDGRLTLQRRYPLRTGEDLLFWSGAVIAPAV